MSASIAFCELKHCGEKEAASPQTVRLYLEVHQPKMPNSSVQRFSLLLLSALVSFLPVRALSILGLPPYLFFAFPEARRVIHNSTVPLFLAKLEFELSHNLHLALGGLIGVNTVASIFY